MTIFEGSEGSLNVFFKDLLISSFPLTKKKTLERYKYQGDHLLEETLREGMDLRTQKFTYLYFCNKIYNQKKEKKAIWTTDHKLFLSCIFGLIKLKELDYEDNILVMSKKKKRKTQKGSRVVG